jgi:hypothetical protein
MNILPVCRLLSVINPAAWQTVTDVPALECDTPSLLAMHDIFYNSSMSNDVDGSYCDNGAFIIGPYDDDGDEG